MKYVNQSVEFLPQKEGLQGVYDLIAECAATCYKSEAKTGESAEAFVKKLQGNKHLAMLEFGTLYLTIPFTGKYEDDKDWIFFNKNPYSKVATVYNANPNFVSGVMYVTTNLRVLVEGARMHLLQFLVAAPCGGHHRRYTLRIITSIGVARELTRHRVFSFAQESTRYCNYSKDKFGKELSFVRPTWVSTIGEGELSYPLRAEEADDRDFTFSWACYEAEKFYLDMIEEGCPPQVAREVLPLCTKTELCMCGFDDDWIHFFDLRKREYTGKVHPDMLALANLMWNELTDKIGRML